MSNKKKETNVSKQTKSSEDKVKSDLKNQKSEVETKVKVEEKKQKSKKIENDQEPTLFHYSVVLGIMAIIFGIFYFGFQYYEDQTEPGVINNPNLKIKLYKYPFTVNDQEYSIEFYNPVTDLEKIDFPIEIDKTQLLNTQEFTFVFTSDKSSNGEVVKASGRLFPFLKSVYKFPLNSNDNIVSSDNLTCADSSIEHKLIFFNSNSTDNKVTYNYENGCIQFLTTNSSYMGTLADKFFVKIINE